MKNMLLLKCSHLISYQQISKLWSKISIISTKYNIHKSLCVKLCQNKHHTNCLTDPWSISYSGPGELCH